jgi:hypothetical protein
LSMVKPVQSLHKNMALLESGRSQTQSLTCSVMKILRMRDWLAAAFSCVGNSGQKQFL